MQSLSSLLSKSKKQSLFQQAYVISSINQGLKDIQKTSYSSLKDDFEKMQTFIIPGQHTSFMIKFRIQDNSFKTFVKTEINNIDFLLREYLCNKGLDKLKFEIVVT